MASRFTKPDPGIKTNVLRSRATARKAKGAHASVVWASIAATIIAWAMFSSQDAQILEAAMANQSASGFAAAAQHTDRQQISATQVPTSPARNVSPR
jgi:hypothetical protein